MTHARKALASVASLGFTAVTRENHMNLKELLDKYKDTRLSYSQPRREAELALMDGLVDAVTDLQAAERKRRGGRPPNVEAA